MSQQKRPTEDEYRAFNDGLKYSHAARQAIDANSELQKLAERSNRESFTQDERDRYTESLGQIRRSFYSGLAGITEIEARYGSRSDRDASRAKAAVPAFESHSKILSERLSKKTQSGRKYGGKKK